MPSSLCGPPTSPRNTEVFDHADMPTYRPPSSSHLRKHSFSSTLSSPMTPVPEMNRHLDSYVFYSINDSSPTIPANQITTPSTDLPPVTENSIPLNNKCYPYCYGGGYPKGIITRNQLIVLLRKGLYMKKEEAFSEYSINDLNQ